jgi:hypothetical protein
MLVRGETTLLVSETRKNMRRKKAPNLCDARVSILTMVVLTPCALVVLYLLVCQVADELNLRAVRRYNKTYGAMVTIANALDELSPDRLTDSLDTTLPDLRNSRDPYSGHPFAFFTCRNGADREWFLVSSGPDRTIEFTGSTGSFLPYDPTNGFRSDGDIVFGTCINPRPLDRGPLPQHLGRKKGQPEENPESWERSYGGFRYVDKPPNGHRSP